MAPADSTHVLWRGSDGLYASAAVAEGPSNRRVRGPGLRTESIAHRNRGLGLWRQRVAASLTITPVFCLISEESRRKPGGRGWPVESNQMASLFTGILRCGVVRQRNGHSFAGYHFRL